jgi:hypothetical protein
MPILPYLTDTKAHLAEALRQVKAAGATTVLYAALHLRPGVKDWFFTWLGREHPHLVEKYGRMYYGKNSYAPKEYRAWLAARIQPLIRAHGLQRGVDDPIASGVRTSAIGMSRSADGERVAGRSIIAEELAPTAALRALGESLGAGQPTLF